MPSLTREIPKNSPLHMKLVEKLSNRIKYANQQQRKNDKWNKADDTVLAYVPESELDAKRRTAREDRGEPKYTTIKLPYTFALLMSAHTYITSVFFGRSPVHQFAGRHGETEQQVQGLEALIGYQCEVGEMMGPYYLWIYDALKYGVGVIEEYWDKEEIQYSEIQEIMNEQTQRPEKALVRVKAPGYEGSRICNISPRDFLPDPRVPVGRFQEGEFVFVRKRLSWETLLRRKAQGYYMNTEHVKSVKDFAGSSGDENSQLERPQDNEAFGDGQYDEGHPFIVPAYEGCVTIVPSEWGLGESDFPEKWMFTITGDLGTVMGAQPHGAMHGKFPYGVLESEVEAYGTWNRGLPEIVEPLQNTMDFLINQHFFNVRAALNNQFILDPSRISTRGAEDGGPGFVYRLRPEAYGQDIRQFFHQIPIADVTSGHVNDMNTMIGIGERVTGINDSIMGVLNAGGRKTATEVRTATGFGVNRLKTMAEYMSAVGFSQHAQRMVQMSQQYYTAEKKFKIAGSLINDMGPNAAMNFIKVSPQDIQGFYNFVPVDGTLPVDRLALANMWKDIMLQLRTVPPLMMQFDLGRIFAHVAQLMGVRNIGQFKLDLASPGGLMQAAQAGNLVPVGGRAPGGGSLPAGAPSAGPPNGTGVAPM